MDFKRLFHIAPETEEQKVHKEEVTKSISKKKVLKWLGIGLAGIGVAAVAIKYGKIPEGLSMDSKDYE